MNLRTKVPVLLLFEITTIAIVLCQPSFVCYEDLGCFSLNGTFKDVAQLLPDPPEIIRTNFQLFTRHNREVGQVLDYQNENTLNVELLQPDRTTFVLVHGFMNVDQYEPAKELTAALLDQSDCQVIVTDWRGGSNTDYVNAVVNSELAGRQIARLVDLLRTRRSLNPSNVHLIGFSLGAQVVGFAGKWSRGALDFTIGRITALDPAGPFFEDSGKDVHVWREDASFVDVIHTAAGRNLSKGETGMEIPVGHVDFYPNGGKAQPGCPEGASGCSHLRVEALFTESVKSMGSCYFDSVPCPEGFEAFQNGQCRDCGVQGCGRMGLPSLSAPGRGIQYLYTNDNSPFCILSAKNNSAQVGSS